MSTGELRHVVVSQGDQRRLVQRSGFVLESHLQQLISSSPELLGPLGGGLQFIPIGYEVPLGSAWRLDLLFLDSEGILTLIETKLRANDEIRREVIGQVLEYALAVEGWTVDTVRERAGDFLSSVNAPDDIRGLALEAALATRLGWLGDEEDERAAKLDALLSRLAANLQRGHLRVVIGVDERIEGLERLVQYFSRHSDLQVVLLQVNRFAVDDSLAVLIPTLHGDVERPASSRASTGSVRLTLGTLIEAFPEGPERDAVSSLMDAASRAGASFEFGPSGTSIRVKTRLWPQPVTVAWVFAPGRPGWMRTRDLSFGHPFVDHPSAPPELIEMLEAYFAPFTLGPGSDASSKGVHARALSPAEVAAMVPILSERLTAIIRELAAAQPSIV